MVEYGRTILPVIPLLLTFSGMNSVFSIRFSVIGFLALLLSAAVSLEAGVLSKWIPTTGSVSMEEGFPVFSSGSTGVVAGMVPPLSLTEAGDTISLSGRIRFEFPEGGMGSDNGFRWGLFNSHARDGNRGWSGYLVMNKKKGTIPFFRKEGGGPWNSVFTEGYSTGLPGTIGGLSVGDLKSGTYGISFVLERTEEGLAASWSLASEDGEYELSGSSVDAVPSSWSFDRIVFQCTSDFGQESVVFSDLKLVGTGSASVPFQLLDTLDGPRVQKERNLPEFPKPNPAGKFAEFKVLDGDGRFYRVPSEDWNGARKRAEEPGWSKWVAARRAELEDWMSRRRDHVEWRAGWGHAFISPKDGSYLTFTPDEPKSMLSSPTDPEVTVTPAIHAAWVNKFRGKHIEQILEAARFYRLTGEKRYLEWVTEQMDFYAENYAGMEPLQSETRKGKLFGNILNDAISMVALAQAARLIWDDVSGEKKVHWRQQFFYPQVRLLDGGYPCPHNIACWHRSAQGLIALLYDDSELWKEVIEGPEGLRRQLAEGVTSDYFWFEQSLGYNYFVVNALVPFFEEVARQGRMEDVIDQAAIVQNLILSPMDLRFPGGLLPNPADITGRLSMDGVVAKLGWAAHLFPTTPGEKEAAGEKSWTTLTKVPAGEPMENKPLPEVRSRLFESTRFAVLKKGDWQIFIQFGQLDRNHAQDETPGFEACYGSIPVSLDPGTVPYGSPLYKSYYKAGLADNVPLVDGRPQDGWARGEVLEFEPEKGRIVVAQRPFIPGWNVIREFQIEGDSFIDRLDLTPVAPGGETRLGFLLHLENPVSIEGGELVEISLAEFMEERLPGFENWSDIQKRSANGEARLRIMLRGVPFDLFIRTQGDFQIYTGRTPGNPPRHPDRLSLLVEKNGSEAGFETVLTPVLEKASPLP